MQELIAFAANVGIDDRLQDAVRAALSSQGKNKGSLKTQCPEAGTDGALMWQALRAAENPYKARIDCIFLVEDCDFNALVFDFAQCAARVYDLKQLDTPREIM